METGTQNQNPTSSTKLQSIFLAAAFVLFVLSLLWGIFAGMNLGKAKATYANVVSIHNALEYYHSDQDAYPTAAQFDNQLILVPLYISAMPKPVNPSSLCAGKNSFVYSQAKPSDFNLQFCLQSATAGLSKGFHVLSEKGVQ